MQKTQRLNCYTKIILRAWLMKSLASWQFYPISWFRFDSRWKSCLLGSYKCCYNVFCLVFCLCVCVCVIWELKASDAFTYRAVFILQVNESLFAYNCHKFSTEIGLGALIQNFFMCIHAFSVVLSHICWFLIVITLKIDRIYLHLFSFIVKHKIQTKKVY